MAKSKSRQLRTVRLDFGGVGNIEREGLVRADLSAVAATGDFLWLGTDEGAAVDRLRKLGDNRYGEHKAFDLKDMLKLPSPEEDAEIDIEGMDADSGCLWVVGSHSYTRDKPELDENDPDQALDELAEVDRNPNRRMLARIPLAKLGGQGGEDQEVAQLKAKKKTSALLDVLEDDRHLGPFMDVPAKENGFDVEGLAVRGGQVLLGLRGPVLRGWAMVLELRVEVDGSKLKLLPITPAGRCYRKHFLDLEGCGIRDLCFLDGDLLILAGPTMDLDGPIRLHRWRPSTFQVEDTITAADKCPVVLDLPVGRGTDHAEGIALLPGSEGRELLVVYDSPAKSRIHGERAVDADVMALDG
ncbi:DUF3616 domain-containing protein [Geminicoccus roseus]|uniref:DUF3616 domain-containing protein n=1 Tax=Geminicoccus roseus TaxID=404900 RepID=UPI000405C2D1|nr:DUF3616 domain-containing protein [Geminicoccus roseus]